MNKEKGFTLIELLAVIVILAIIALIATPLILGVIEDSRLKSLGITASNIISAGELYLATNAGKPGDITTLNNYDVVQNEETLSYKGKVDKGRIFIKENGETAIYVVSGKNCALKSFTDKAPKTFKITEDRKCELSNTGTLPEESACLTTPTDGTYTLKDIPRDPEGQANEYFYDNLERERINSIKFIKENTVPTTGTNLAVNGDKIKMNVTVSNNMNGTGVYDIIISSDKKILAAENSSYFFSKMMYITAFDLSNYDTCATTNTSYMFNHFSDTVQYPDDNSYLTLDLSNLDTSKVTDMSGMFQYAGFDTRNLKLNISNLNTSNVTNMSNMFKYTHQLKGEETLDLSSFDTSKVTNMSNMFTNLLLPSLDLSKFNTKLVTEYNEMFKWSNFSLDLSSFTINEETKLADMLKDVENTREIKVKDQVTKDLIEAKMPNLTNIKIK